MASVARHLSEFANAWPSLLSVHEKTIYRAIELLERNRVVRCVNAKYSFTQGRAKEYVFSGPPVVAEEADSAA